MARTLNSFPTSDRQLCLGAHCFGKLPFARDFLKFRGGGASQRFERWIDLSDRCEESPRIDRAQRVLFLPEKGEEYVVATVWGSSDESGRAFPFALYFEPRRGLLAPCAERPILQSLELWRFLEEQATKLSQATESGEFYRRLREVRFTNPLQTREPAIDCEQELAAISTRSLASAIFGDDPLDDWVRLLWRLSQTLDASLDSLAIRSNLALKLPLGSEIPYALQIEAWLQAIRHHLGADPSLSLSLPSVFFPRDAADGPASAFLFFRALREGDVQLLRGETPQLDLVDLTVSDPGMEVSGYGDFFEIVEAGYEDPESDLRRILP